MNKIRIHVTYIINLSYNCVPVDLLFCHLNNFTRNLFTVHVEVYAENRIDEPFLILIFLLYSSSSYWLTGLYFYCYTRNRLNFKCPTNVILRRGTVESKKKKLLLAFWNCEDDVRYV